MTKLVTGIRATSQPRPAAPAKRATCGRSRGMSVPRAFLSRTLAIAWVVSAANLPAAGHQSSEAVAVASEIGLTPESIVVAGLHESASAFLERLEAATDLRSTLAALHAEHDAAAAAITELSEGLAAQSDNEDLVVQYSAALEAHAALREQISSVRQELRAVALEGVPDPSLELLAHWRAAAAYRVPPAFRVLDLTSDQWTEAALAIRAEQRAIRRGTPLGEDHAQLLAQLRAEPIVAQAQTRLDLYLPLVRQLFQQYLYG